MSHDGSTAQPSCTTVPLGKSVRRALRAAIGVPKKPRKDKTKKKPNPAAAAAGSGSSSTELMSMSLSKEAAAAMRESVVRVVLSSGVVEVYPRVVLACNVIRRHPPGLCLAHPDVFRNPHGAVLRPHEPLFPGQKLLLIPWSTVGKLKRKIPESSVGAFADEYYADADEDDEDTAGSEEVSTETEAEEEKDQLEHIGGAPGEEWGDEAAAGDGGSGSFMPACSAREYFVARDRWSECRFKAQGIAVEPSADDDDDQPADQSKDKQARKKGNKKKKKKRKGSKKRRERRPAAAPPLGFRAFATLRRAWEPSLPAVVEEENAVSPLSLQHQVRGGHQNR